jgi:hypothetical protein
MLFKLLAECARYEFKLVTADFRARARDAAA